MTEMVRFLIEQVAPDSRAVLEAQGLGPGTSIPPRIDALCASALALLATGAEPVGMIAEISGLDFEAVYRGEGRNEPQTPVGDIYGRADHLAVFAVTLGGAIGQEVDALFAANDFALGNMLDSAASLAADQAVGALETHYRNTLLNKKRANRGTVVLAYSPGYCGWHISGQKKLFEFLHPERIGITLKDSFLMEPLKSVSGVLIAAPAEAHSFADTYAFCSKCDTHGCRERLRAAPAERTAE
jgi:hypothetical protein